MKLRRYATCNYSEFDYHSEGPWVKYPDAEALEERNKELEEENAKLEERVAYLESCICETCHDPKCTDSALGYYVQECRYLEKENGYLRKLVDEVHRD